MKIKDIKKVFCAVTGHEEKKELNGYSNLLDLNKNFEFVLSKNKVADESEFKAIVKEAEALLKHDLKRFGEDLEIVPAKLRNMLIGTIGSMTIVADNDGKLSVKFHKRDKDGFWDGESKKYPEKATTGKWKHEIFFAFEDEEDED